MTKKQALAAALALVPRAEIFHLTTNAERGYPETRVMLNLMQMRAAAIAGGPVHMAEAFGSWIATNTGSRKVAQVRRDPKACLYYSDNKTFEGVTLFGRLTLVKDPAVKAMLWMPEWEKYYKGGREGGDFAVLRFVPERGHYYRAMCNTEFDASGPHRKRKARSK